MSRMNQFAVLLLCAAAVLSGCSKKEEAGSAPKAAEPATIADATSVVKAQEAVEEKMASVIPLADRSTPLTSYQKLDGGRRLVFAYLAVSPEPLDYQKVAALASTEYANSGDEFRKRDLMQTLRPQIDADIEKAKGNKYYYMTIGGGLDKYNFETKSFRHQGFIDPTSFIYFEGSLGNYRLVFTNSEKFKQLVVDDEATARRIETLRATGDANAMATRVYFFASSSEPGKTVVRAELVRIQLIDREGNILLEM